MCKKSDIILVSNYISQGNLVGKHPFVVIEDQGGQIQGVSFDMIGKLPIISPANKEVIENGKILISCFNVINPNDGGQSIII